jgi:hypothetical protein
MLGWRDGRRGSVLRRTRHATAINIGLIMKVEGRLIKKSSKRVGSTHRSARRPRAKWPQKPKDV